MYGGGVEDMKFVTLNQDRSHEYIIIDWTELVDFYAKLGFDVWKSYGQCEKDL